MIKIQPSNAANSKSKISDKSAAVIIGAGFGDEGKGLLTDFYAAPYGKDCIVTRFNGGAQAGHTVVLPDGQRHVHSHFGSGTLTGAATFLSRFFVNNPLLFRREAVELEKKGIALPVCFADERGLVTTPFDMLINQWVEISRGSRKHGSCGVGFGETIERCLDERFAIRVSDLADTGKLRAMLNDIRQNWTAVRLQKLNVPKLTGEQKELLAADKLLDDFIEAANGFYASIKLARPDILRTAAGVVFEGAQGLLLDEDYGWFPHVTRSHTGLNNAARLAAEAGINRLDCVYATRVYATRHGAGHLPHELAVKPFSNIKDSTNIPNPHQDSLRFGWLDLDLLGSTINVDFERYGLEKGTAFTKKLVVTCLDQLDNQQVSFVSGGKICETSAENLLVSAAQAVKINEVYASYGQTRETMSKIT